MANLTTFLLVLAVGFIWSELMAKWDRDEKRDAAKRERETRDMYRSHGLDWATGSKMEDVDWESEYYYEPDLET